MTVSTRPYFRWGSSGWNSLAPQYQSCSASLNVLGGYLRNRWGGGSLGCHNQRPIRGGRTLSTHAYGAALDWRFPNRSTTVSVMNWLIANSKELGINAIHDYAADRIWYPGPGWHPYSTSGDWIHIETTPEAFGDGRPVEMKLVPAKPLPPPGPSMWDPLHRNYGLYPLNANKPAMQYGWGYTSGTQQHQGMVTYLNLVLIVEVGAVIPEPFGVYHLQTVAWVQNVQRFFKLPITGKVDAATWKVIDFLASRKR